MRYTLFIGNKGELSADSISALIKLTWSYFDNSIYVLYSEWMQAIKPHIFDNKDNRIIWQKNNQNLITHK